MKQKENRGAAAYDCSFAKKRRCVLIAPQGRHKSAKRNKILGDIEMAKLRISVTAAAMAVLLTGAQALAADGPQLAPGKPVGVQTAQHGSRHLLLIGGAALAVVVGIAVAVATTDNSQCTTACAVPTTTG
jgi:hypothetical protein